MVSLQPGQTRPAAAVSAQEGLTGLQKAPRTFCFLFYLFSITSHCVFSQSLFSSSAHQLCRIQRIRPALNAAIYQNSSSLFALQTRGNLAKSPKHADVNQESQNCHSTDTVGATPLRVAQRGTGELSVKVLKLLRYFGASLELFCFGNWEILCGLGLTPHRGIECSQLYPDTSLGCSELGMRPRSSGITEHRAR